MIHAVMMILVTDATLRCSGAKHKVLRIDYPSAMLTRELVQT